MKRFSYHLLLVALILSLSLSACSRALSTPPVPTKQGTLGFKVQGEPTLNLAMFATQTAIAGGAAPKAVETTAAPAPVEQPTVAATEQPQVGGGAPTSAPASAPSNGGNNNQTTSFEPTPGRPATYTLQHGEWPICIARRFNINLGEFFAANGLNMNSRPGAGTELKIPSGGSWSDANGPRALRAHGSTHTVQANETIYSIACSYGDIDPEGIIVVNGLQSPYTLAAGQSIKLP